MTREMKDVYVVGGVRTPFCRSGTGYGDLTNLDLMSTAIDGLVTKYKLQNVQIDEVVGGAVITHAKDWNIAREAVVGSKLAQTTPAITMMQACGTGLQAMLGSSAKIAVGQIDCAVSLCSDTVSDAPVVFKRKMAQRLISLSKARSFKEKIGAFKGFSLRDLVPMPPSTNEPRTGLPMGGHCELMAKEWAIKREDQDLLAFESHKKAAAAYDEGYFDDLIVPCNGVFRDNNMRPDIELEKLATLRTAFDKTEAGTLTAANSTPLTDGASAVLVSNSSWAKEHGYTPLARVVDAQTSAVDYVAGEGLLMAPVRAIVQMLERQNLTLDDFDFFEIHEAFAAQVLCTLKALEDETYCINVGGGKKALGTIDRTKLNVKGSSLAVGHPFAATGGRIVALASKLLHEKGSGRCLISICTAGGMGVTAILEAA